MRREYISKEDESKHLSLDAIAIDLAKQRRLIAKEYDKSSEHPTVEQMFIRQAIKFLTPKQRAVWEYHNYDRLTQDEIAEKLNITQQVVGKHIKAIEKRIAKWCKSNMGAYELLKKDYLGLDK